MDMPKRYHPVLVVLHWLTVVLLLGAGFLAEDDGRSPVSIHMILGSLLLAALIARLIVRFMTKRPVQADTGNALLNRLGGLVHLGLYGASLLILGLGGVIAVRRNLFAAVLGMGLANDQGYRIIQVHHLIWFLLFPLVAAHVVAALYHQFILKDHLLGRMWFGRG